MKKKWISYTLIALLLVSFLTSCGSGPPKAIGGNDRSSSTVIDLLPDSTENSTHVGTDTVDTANEPKEEIESWHVASATAVTLAEIPDYNGSPYVAINGNIPYFTDADLTTISFERYSQLDSLGRCGVAYACVGKDIMPTEDRSSIGQVKPAGWHTVRYDCVDGGYLYNRCHLIGYQLSGENANEENLITGTRYLNVEGMLPFENLVADYVQETDNHVLYRVTPVYDGNDLLASGVLMEGYSVEDEGEAITYCVFAYNVQPGVTINYATGDSELNSNTSGSESVTQPAGEQISPTTSEQTNGSSVSVADYVLNNNTQKFHLPSCSSVDDIKLSNREDYHGSREALITKGYIPCKRCNP